MLLKLGGFAGIIRNPTECDRSHGATSAAIDRAPRKRRCCGHATLLVLGAPVGACNHRVGSLQVKATKRLATGSHGLRRIAVSGIAFAIAAIILQVRIPPAFSREIGAERRDRAPRLNGLSTYSGGRGVPSRSEVKTVREKAFRDVIARSHLPALDGLRAVAVFTVVASHSNLPLRIPGDLGVSAFFVLSGFLITRLLVRERERTGEVSIRRFYIRRTMRIFPAYYAFLLLSYALDARAGQQWGNTLVANALTYTVNYFNAFNHHPSTSVAHAWSLAVEEQFYLLWPLAFVILATRGRRALVTGVGLAALGAVAWRSWLFLGAHVDPSYVYNAFDTRLDNLAVGCLLALAVDSDRAVAAAETLAKQPWFPIATLALLLTSRLALPDSYHYSIGFTVDALLVATLIVQLLQLYQTRLWCWLEWPAIRYLGAISYPIYLYHQWGASVGRRLAGDAHAFELAAGVMATIVMATGSYYVIERPFLKLKARYAPEMRRRKSPTEDPAPSGVLAAST
jgi:peptidoglycan/LPS O-acetylase OafA/YrhL